MKEKRWKPEKGEMYWYFGSDGNAFWGSFTGVLAERRFKSGNCFKTEAEAVAAAEKVKDLLLSLQPACNQLATSLQHDELPKMTAEVFDREDCPEWARYAAVDKDGTGFFYKTKPRCVEDGWICVPFEFVKTFGTFDSSDWQNSLIERPKKRVNWDEVEEILCNSKLTFKERKQELPDWCKVGEWVYCTKTNNYGKILTVDEEKVNICINPDETFSAKTNMMLKYGRTARLRPYNAEEMRGLVGKIICEANASHVATTCIHHDGTDYLRLGVHLYEAEELISKGFTIAGKPCGVLEHLENGEWVR